GEDRVASRHRHAALLVSQTPGIRVGDAHRNALSRAAVDKPAAAPALVHRLLARPAAGVSAAVEKERAVENSRGVLRRSAIASENSRSLGGLGRQCSQSLWHHRGVLRALPAGSVSIAGHWRRPDLSTRGQAWSGRRAPGARPRTVPRLLEE